MGTNLTKLGLMEQDLDLNKEFESGRAGKNQCDSEVRIEDLRETAHESRESSVGLEDPTAFRPRGSMPGIRGDILDPFPWIICPGSGRTTETARNPHKGLCTKNRQTLMLWVVSEDMERDVFMSAAEAQVHGIVDLVAVA
ncbi:hypothetical protein SADUNF_SadunfMtG0007700 (mitochondrion) [Salix dunnii]|uniref:ATP-dependent Clp protease proteolytic subunit n=1 Tax=Salix dunnii TaxID=1413687 RepID=A0A835J074_9ROSI|nr:hypothetical protein SADUNF_SadunfMtG0007700 [Salix dunnii]